VAETAAILGDVKLGDNCSLWYGAVLRGDENSIEIGDRVNIQDCTVVHVSEGDSGKVRIGSDVIIGHNATVHACTVGNHCLIGMGATVLDGAVVGTARLWLPILLSLDVP
jgi:Carbonic anhydrases/acetyltransferases, isoleucine patch superfamily